MSCLHGTGVPRNLLERIDNFNLVHLLENQLISAHQNVLKKNCSCKTELAGLIHDFRIRMRITL